MQRSWWRGRHSENRFAGNEFLNNHPSDAEHRQTAVLKWWWWLVEGAVA
jgi:hypothetical protein